MMTEDSRRGVAYVIGLSVLALAIQLYVDTGEVFDGVTGEPLEDVHVISRWNGDWFAGVRSHRVCFKVDATRTSRMGKFTLLSNSFSLNPMMSEPTQTLIYYKPGYQIRALLADSPRDAVALIPDNRKGVERLEDLAGRSRSANCWIRGTEPRAALPLFRSVYEEMKSLGQSAEEQRFVNAARALVEAIEKGE